MNKYIIHLTALLFLTSSSLVAQITDDFTDGDFTSGPVWGGDDALWEVDTTTYELHLNAPAVNDDAYLSSPSTTINNATWEFYIRMEFNPSGSNFANIYLVSDQSNLEGTLNGYFVKIGNTADEISLYRQDGAAEVIIIDGPDGDVDNGSPEVRVRVTRDGAGNWELFADATGGTTFASLGTVTDATYTTSAFSGIVCTYTSSRSDLFYYDDFNDPTPPEINNINILSDTQLEVFFKEKVDQASAETAANYAVDNGVGNAITAVRDGTDFTKVTLTFGNAFPIALLSTLTINNVADLALNTNTNEQVAFTYIAYSAFDVLITEVMPDPSPQVLLPNSEYIELYNNSALLIDLQNWQLGDPSSTITFPSIALNPGEYLIVCDVADIGLFTPYGTVHGDAAFPSLNNTDDIVTLTDNNANLIHKIEYDISWYGDPGKDDGGWSLEMVDINNPCSGKSNWTASTDDRGGTPGQQNSVFSSNPDTESPFAIHAYPNSPTNVTVYFNEWLNSTANNTSNYSIDNGIGTPTTAVLGGTLNDEVTLTLPASLTPGTTYTININGLNDCVANNGSSTVRVAIPDNSILPNDIVINEILFDPIGSGSDFVELYNRSGKVLDLKQIKIANAFVNGTLDQIEPTRQNGFLFFPGDYLVLNEANDNIEANYTVPRPAWLVEINDLPSYNNDAGTVVVIDSVSAARIDEFTYTDDMHFDLYDDPEGVTLERINPNATTQDENNWHSAAEAAGYGTPTAKNSQLDLSEAENNEFEVLPKVFSPDGDGFEDFTAIHYQLGSPGNVANIRIFDAAGRQIKQLANNMTLSAEGSIQWDGVTDDGQKARKGIYVVLIELFRLNGDKEQEKLTVVVGGKL